MAFPLLVALVAIVVILGVLQYWVLLALGSVIYLAFLGWRQWQRAPAAVPRRNAKTRPRRTTKPKRAPASHSRRR